MFRSGGNYLGRCPFLLLRESLRWEGAPKLVKDVPAMDGRFWDGPAAGREGGNLHVKREEPDREKMIAARARQRAIGRELRRMYDEVVQEPVPDDFLDLLKKIDETKGK